jgi:hypothetical protein
LQKKVGLPLALAGSLRRRLPLLLLRVNRSTFHQVYLPVWPQSVSSKKRQDRMCERISGSVVEQRAVARQAKGDVGAGGLSLSTWGFHFSDKIYRQAASQLTKR